MVLGALRWRVIHQRVPVERKRWIVANAGPALLGWLILISPAVTTAEDAGTSISDAYLPQPLLYQVATGILSEGQIAVSLRDVLKRHRNVECLLAEVIDDVRDPCS